MEEGLRTAWGLHLWKSTLVGDISDIILGKGNLCRNLKAEKAASVNYCCL